MDEDTRLNEFDKEEWWDVCRRARPDITREQYDQMWNEFQAMKAEHLRQNELQ